MSHSSITGSKLSCRRKLVALPALLLTALWGLSGAYAGSEISITEPWVREAPPAVRVHAAYAVLHNKAAEPAQLIAAASPDYKTIELHSSKVSQGVATMVRQDRINIPAKGMVKMAPGGFHLMLMHPKRRLKAGDAVEITLGFADGSEKTFQAPVKKADAMPHQMPHKGH